MDAGSLGSTQAEGRKPKVRTTRASSSAAGRTSSGGRKRVEVGTAQDDGEVEDAAEPVEREVRQHQLGLVADDGGAARRRGRGAAASSVEPGDQQVLERVGRRQIGVHAVEQAAGLVAHDGLDQALLAAGEHPVDGGAADAGLAGDVVERGLADAPAGDAGEGGLRRGGARRRRRRGTPWPGVDRAVAVPPIRSRPVPWRCSRLRHYARIRLIVQRRARRRTDPRQAGRRRTPASSWPRTRRRTAAGSSMSHPPGAPISDNANRASRSAASPTSTPGRRPLRRQALASVGPQQVDDDRHDLRQLRHDLAGLGRERPLQHLVARRAGGGRRRDRAPAAWSRRGRRRCRPASPAKNSTTACVTAADTSSSRPPGNAPVDRRPATPASRAIASTVTVADAVARQARVRRLDDAPARPARGRAAPRPRLSPLAQQVVELGVRGRPRSTPRHGPSPPPSSTSLPRRITTRRRTIGYPTIAIAAKMNHCAA